MGATGLHRHLFDLFTRLELSGFLELQKQNETLEKSKFFHLRPKETKEILLRSELQFTDKRVTAALI